VCLAGVLADTMKDALINNDAVPRVWQYKNIDKRYQE
jgi:hypothetical protein